MLTNYGVGHHAFIPFTLEELPKAVETLLACSHDHRFEVRKDADPGTGLLVSGLAVQCLLDGGHQNLRAVVV